MRDIQFIHFFKILVLSVILFIPLIGKELGLEQKGKLNENRVLAQVPKFELNNFTKFTEDYIKYYNDSFGFRDSLVKLNQSVKIHNLKTSPRQDVVLGEDGWLFFTPDIDPSQYANLTPYTQSELTQVKKNLRMLNSFFAKYNAKFYFLVAPASQTIYPEFLPNKYKLLYQHTKLKQLTEYLKNENDINFINPSGDLVQDKNNQQLYYKYDLHWNSYGAFIAYQTLMQKISEDFPNIKPKASEDFILASRESKQKDLENLIGMTGENHESEPTFNPKKPPTFSLNNDECQDIYQICGSITAKNINPELPTLVMYRDSYGAWLVPFLSEHFSHATYLWQPTPFQTEIIKEQKPSVVILEMTERNMWMLTQDLFSGI